MSCIILNETPLAFRPIDSKLSWGVKCGLSRGDTFRDLSTHVLWVHLLRTACFPKGTDEI